MNARRDLTNQGKVQLYGAVSNEFVDNIRSIPRHDGLAWSNGTWDGEMFDTHRISAFLPDPVTRVLMATFERHYLTFFPHTTAAEFTVQRTRAGARDSPVRRDFSPPAADIHAADFSAMPGVILFATQDNTILYGYGWNRLVAFRSNAETIVMNKGDMLLLRGDYMYSPAGYDTNNLLLRADLDTPFYMRDLEGADSELVATIDDISVVDDLFCYVHNCQFVAKGTTSLGKHLRRYHGFLFGRPRLQAP